MLGRSAGACGMRGFFFEGETSFDGLTGAGGVVGRETGGALYGDRCFLGVGELQDAVSFFAEFERWEQHTNEELLPRQSSLM